MDKIKIIIADDMDDIHEDLRRTLDSVGFEYVILEDFYDTSSLKLYLRDVDSTDYVPDIILLDYDFGGTGENGIEVIPKLREYCPNIPILMLTTYDDTRFYDAHEKYSIGYIQKPVKATDLRFQIKSIIKWMYSIESLHKDILENHELMDYLEEENRLLANTVEIERNENVEHVLPIEMQQLIRNIFPDVEIPAKSFRLIAKNKKLEQAEWNRMFRTLKMIDWKNESVAPAGIKIQKYNEGIKFGYKNMWEYRFSQKGRIFVERRKENKPLIVLIDPEHQYDGLSCL